MTGRHDRTITAARAVVRDRRELPFFQVRLKAVRAIRHEVSGPRRLRTIGFYALLCQIANEQRHTGEHRRLEFNYDLLALRGGVAKRNVKLMLDFLQRARVVSYERQSDPDRGATVSVLQLLVQDGAWTGITVAMAERLAAKREGGHLLRELGLVIVLLEFCVAQRGQLDRLSAEVSRADIAASAGLNVDRLDQCNQLLQAAGVLTITRRRPPNGGRNLASLYTIHEAPTREIDRGAPQGREMEPAAPQNGTHRSEERNWQGRRTKLAAPTNETARAEDWNSQGGNSPASRTGVRPSDARAGSAVEDRLIENTPTPGGAAGGGGAGVCSPEQELCEALLAAWGPALGDGPRRDYHADRSRWLASAGALLERHPRERLADALTYMVTDEILGSQALSMPGFAKVADRLIARAYARRQRAIAGLGRIGSAGYGLGWEEAKQALERAVQRHGRDGRAAALEELAARSELLVRFVERVRWSVLCEQPMRFAERHYAELWAELGEKSNGPSAEHAA